MHNTLRAIVLISALATLQSASRGSQLLWSTGTPQAVFVQNNGTKDENIIFEYFSGYVDADSPQRFAAIPFRLAQNAKVTGINALYSDETDGVRTNPMDVSYIIWGRSGLAAPTSIAAEGSFGAYQMGAKYESADVPFDNDYIHEHVVNFSLAAGDYYLTLYSKDTTINWVTGGSQPDATLEQSFMWRSAKLPTPGFVQYTFPFTTELLTDSKDVYNPIFAIVGEPVPEPSACIVLIAAAMPLFIALRRRKQR